MRDATKRAVDLVVAAILLLVLAVPMAAIAVAVRMTMGPPVLFVQHRPGRGGRLFPLLKFRTMAPARTTTTAEDAQRVTRLGRLLRSTSFDELPELLNVLRGEMSLVGPRPLLAEYLPRYDPVQGRRHEVRPGITGLAQTAGRKGLSWDETFALDVWYVDHRSLGLDACILLRTLWDLVSRVGRTSDEDFNRPDFTGAPTATPRTPHDRLVS